MKDDGTSPALRSPLGRVRHLGSARKGTEHWIAQRVTSIALLPLTVWFLASMVTLAGASYIETVLWLSHPLNAVLMLALLGLTFHHTAAGLQVVVEDYVRPESRKLAVILAIRAVCWLGFLAAALAVLRVALSH